MNRTILVISYNRPIQEPTRALLGELISAGVAIVTQTGCADVALARNLALTGACRAYRQLNAKLPEDKQRDLFLLVDDDMLFELDQVKELLAHVRTTGISASAMYATAFSTIAATRLREPENGEPQRWVTGLGLLAIPAAALLELEQNSETFPLKNGRHTAFTWSAIHEGFWYSEDYTLTRRLGGVHVLPMAVGHLKTIPIYPDKESVALIRDGKRLPGDRLVTEPIEVR